MFNLAASRQKILKNSRSKGARGIQMILLFFFFDFLSLKL